MEELQETQLSRRNFLQLIGISAGTVALGACSPAQEAGQPEPTQPIAPTIETGDTPAEKHALHENVTATVFWIGEPADESNDYISNVPTAWDQDASKRFGGYDGPTRINGAIHDVARDGHGVVTEFKPRHNPFYFALPAGEFNEDGLIPGARERSPWANEQVNYDESLFKGRWIQVTADDKTIYAQWLDIGPNAEDDYDYVFGDDTQQPKNTFGLRAGLDLSPAAAISLGFDDGGQQVGWRFVDAADVPDGPWKQYPPIDNKTYWD
jgi:hypothetical protein